jgi:hypothetical protein
MRKVAIIAGIAGVLLFSNSALADEATKDEHSGHGTTQVQPSAKQGPASTTPVEQPAATATHEEHNMTPEEHASHEGTTVSHEEEEASTSGGHGHGNVVETPANIPVLTTFGAINVAFILFGVWNKWFRKKEVLA